MYSLVIFGEDVEDYLGKGRYLLIFLTATVIGCLLHMAPHPESTSPAIGASGGISALIVFYVLQFPSGAAEILVGRPLFSWVRIRATTALVYWIVVQLMGASRQIEGSFGVSFLAHLDGTASRLPVLVDLVEASSSNYKQEMRLGRCLFYL